MSLIFFSTTNTSSEFRYVRTRVTNLDAVKNYRTEHGQMKRSPTFDFSLLCEVIKS